MRFEEAQIKFYQTLIELERSPETVKGYTKDLRMFQAFLKESCGRVPCLEEIGAKAIEDYLEHLKSKEYKLSSQNRHFNTLRSLFNQAYKRGWIKQNVTTTVKKINVPFQERTYLYEQEVQQLLETIGHPLIRLVVRTLYQTGLRISECLNLTVDDVDLENNLLHVRAGKGKKARTIPIGMTLSPYLLDYVKNGRVDTESTFFFALKRSGKLSSAYVNRVLTQAVEQLGWNKNVSCHTLRHSFASQLVKNNVHPVSIQKLLGHATLKTTSVYTHVNEEQLEEAVNSL
jgi:integrase/recombinase XerD